MTSAATASTQPDQSARPQDAWAVPGALKGLLAPLMRISPPWLIVILITTILALGEWQHGILGGYDRLAAALCTCMVADGLLGLFVRGKWPMLQSAYVSGISLSLLTKPQGGELWPFFVGALLAIGSKYVLAYNNRHLWNPTNFAICALLLLSSEKVSVLSHQWGNDPATLAVVWGFGLIITWRAKVVHLTVTYLICFPLFAALRALIVPTTFVIEMAPLTGPMYQLFIFFMITDPRTTVRSFKWRVITVIAIAAVECAIRLMGDFHVGLPVGMIAGAPLFALGIVGPIAMGIDQHLKKQSDAAKAASAASPA